ncbi:MAG: hypothetical protein LBJ21_01825 [Acidobacteriota bacterium]|jgi:hypothetical protein|nr:hypothetical protein [Acidobacteriota bacterium]
MKIYLSSLIGLAVFVGIIAVAGAGIADMRYRNSEQQLIVQKKAVERAAVLCYALEGFYPPRIEYLEEKYGLIVNRDKFMVFYRTFGSNIRPEISIHRLFSNLETFDE